MYLKMYASGGSHLVSNGQENSHNSKVLLEEDDTTGIRCLCGFPIYLESMVQCEDPQCHVLQHANCVLIPEDQAVVIPSVRPQHYCEICRINRADPFCVTVAQPLLPVKFTDSGTTTNTANRINNVTTSFHLGMEERNLLQNTEYDVQVWCILLNDRVPFRIHWPLYAKLLINGIQVQTHNRPDKLPLGANGRDDGPLVKACMREGANTISLSGCDSRIFSFGVRVVERRTLKQWIIALFNSTCSIFQTKILDLISNQQDGEKWEGALARVRRCIGGGPAVEGTDGDLEVVTESVTVNIRCPISGSRIRIAGRFKSCTHIGCFDLDAFVELTERTKKWQCPICLKNYSLENICTDPYFSCITSMLQHCEDDVTEVEIKPDGCWRVKDETKCNVELAQWHCPDDTIHINSLKKNMQLEIDKTCNELEFESGGELPEKLSCFCQNNAPLSSSLAINHSDARNHTSRHDSGGLYALPPIMGTRPGSVTRFDNDVRLPDNPCASSAGAEMIILSDSDDENEKSVSSGSVYQFGQPAMGKTFQNVPYTAGWDSRFPESTFSGTTNHHDCNSNSCCNGNFEAPYSALASSSSGSSQFLLTGSKAIDSGANPHQRLSIEHPSTVNDTFMAPMLDMLSSRQMSDILQGSVSNTSYNQACMTLDNYEVDFHMQNMEHSNSKYQLGESNFVNCGQWNSFSVGSYLCHEISGRISSEKVTNFGNQVSGLEGAMSCPMITGLTSSLYDHVFDKTANSRGIDNTLYFSHQKDNVAVHSYCTQQSLKPCFIHTSSMGDSVDSTNMMQPPEQQCTLGSLAPNKLDWTTNATRNQQCLSLLDDAYIPRE